MTDATKSGKPLNRPPNIKDPKTISTGKVPTTSDGNSFNEKMAQFELAETGDASESNDRHINEILNSIQDDFYVLDRNWKFVYASRRFTSRIGKEPKDFLGNNIWEMFPKHVGTEYQENLFAAMHNREIRRFEIGGKYTQAYYSMAVFPSEDGITVLGTDITKQKRIQEALRESESKYRHIVETAHEGIWMLDQNNLTIFVNARMSAMLGYSEDELMGNPPRKYAAPDFLEKVEGLMQEHENGKDQLTDWKYIRKDGTHLWCLVSSKPIVDEAGNYKGSLAMITDITERKKAETKLQQSEARYRMLHESLRDAFVQVDMEGRFIEFNKLFCEMLQYSPEELLSLNYEDLTPEYWHAYEQSIIQEQIIPQGYSQFYEKEYRRKDGTIFPVELRRILSVDDEGKPVGMWAIVRDISDRKLAEEKLKHQAQELRELNALKDKFFSIIAHDLKNPFALLIGTSEIMSSHLEKLEMESVKRLAEIINQAAQNGHELLDNLLEWSKSQTGSIQFNPGPLNLKQEIEKNFSAINTYAANKNIRLISDVSPDLNIIADKHMLSTVIRNLLENAIKFTHVDGEVSVVAVKNDNETNIIVGDSGIGISQEDMSKLFRIDIKYSRPGTAKEKGTGLGLILCKEFVEKHGGKIRIESIVGKGTEIGFTIPDVV